MKPSDLNQLWNDALGDLPEQAQSDDLRRRMLEEVHAQRQRRRIRAASLCGLVLLVAGGWTHWSFRRADHSDITVAVPPQPAPKAPATIEPQPPSVAPIEPPALREDATVPVVESVPLKEFLAKLPHHGYMTVRNERGRFLIVVDNQTGEQIMTPLADDETL